MKDLKLYNRYGDHVSLHPINENEYEFHSEDPYVRIGDLNIVDEKRPEVKFYSFIDPSGGPFIQEGDILTIKENGKYEVIKYILGVPEGIHIITEEKDDISSNHSLPLI